MDELRRLRRRWHRTRQRWKRNDGRVILLLLAIVFGGTASAGVYSHVQRLSRSSTARVTIEAQSFRPGRSIPDEVRQGHWLRYAYVVGGVTYGGTTFRPWTDVEAYEAKICYDPDDPADHLLVPGRYECGD